MTVRGSAAAKDMYLREVPEDEAEGVVADVYADIRDVLGLPLVNLFYRCLAVEPARLASIWQALRPNLISRRADDLSRRLVEVAAGPGHVTAAGFSSVGADDELIAGARATLDAYARGNSHNLLAMYALRNGCRGTGVGSEPADRAAALAVPPMVSLDALAPETLRFLRKTSTRLVGEEEPVLVPSLLRHLAMSPLLFASLWSAVEPVLDSSLDTGREAVGEEASVLARQLPYAVTRLQDESERNLATRFARAMSTLLFVGETFRAAPPEGS